MNINQLVVLQHQNRKGYVPSADRDIIVQTKDKMFLERLDEDFFSRHPPETIKRAWQVSDFIIPTINSPVPLVFSLEGTDGVGKTRTFNFLKDLLGDKGFQRLGFMQFPSHTGLYGSAIRKTLKSEEQNEDAKLGMNLCRQTAYIVDRVEQLSNCPYSVVIADRFSPSVVTALSQENTQEAVELYTYTLPKMERKLSERVHRLAVVVLLEDKYGHTEKLLDDRGEKDIFEQNRVHSKMYSEMVLANVKNNGCDTKVYAVDVSDRNGMRETIDIVGDILTYLEHYSGNYARYITK